MAQNGVTHQKIKKVPEVEASVDERLSANGSQKQTLSKSRENEALMESQAVPAWAKIHTLPSPPPSLSRTLKLSGSEKLHGWPPSLTELRPLSQKLSETPEDSWWRQSLSTLPNCSASPSAQLPQRFWGPLRESHMYSPILSWPRPGNVWCLVESGVSGSFPGLTIQ